MAEAFGIAGGIASFPALMKQLISFYNFYENLRDVPEDVQNIVTEITTLRSSLNTSGLYSQQLESQGYDAEEFRSLLLETSKWLKKVEEMLEDCTAEASIGRGLTLGKRIRFLFKKKKIGGHIGVLERMKAFLMAARSNLER